MKIICIEEHTIDTETAKATRQVQAAEAGYMADWGSTVEDKPAAFSDNRPHLLSVEAVMELASDIGASRIAEMDKHGIDMQVLSYSSSPQLASASQAVDLTRAANDRLAQAVRANPTRFGGFATLPWQDPRAAALELDVP